MKILNFRWRMLPLGPHVRRRALRSAEVLDDVVDAQVAELPRLPEDLRIQYADYLAELVELSQDYRHFAAGWISRRELRRRGNATLCRLESCKRSHVERLTERR